MQEGKEGSEKLNVTGSLTEMEKWIEKGRGNDDWTVITKETIG